MPARDEPEYFVTWVLRAICDEAPGLSTVAVLTVEMATRRKFGGSRPYIIQRMCMPIPPAIPTPDRRLEVRMQQKELSFRLHPMDAVENHEEQGSIGPQRRHLSQQC